MTEVPSYCNIYRQRWTIDSAWFSKGGRDLHFCVHGAPPWTIQTIGERDVIARYLAVVSLYVFLLPSLYICVWNMVTVSKKYCGWCWMTGVQRDWVKFVFSPDIIPSGWLGSKQQLTTATTINVSNISQHAWVKEALRSVTQRYNFFSTVLQITLTDHFLKSVHLQSSSARIAHCA